MILERAFPHGIKGPFFVRVGVAETAVVLEVILPGERLPLTFDQRPLRDVAARSIPSPISPSTSSDAIVDAVAAERERFRALVNEWRRVAADLDHSPAYKCTAAAMRGSARQLEHWIDAPCCNGTRSIPSSISSSTTDAKKDGTP